MCGIRHRRFFHKLFLEAHTNFHGKDGKRRKEKGKGRIIP